MSEDEDPTGTTGIPVFDELPKAERLALLARVAKGLCDEGELCPDLTALTEGTVAAVFAHLLYLIEVEMELIEDWGGGSHLTGRNQPISVREMVLAAARQVDLDFGSLVPECGSDEIEAWSDLIDALRDRILWDDGDYLAGIALLDIDPDLACALKEQLGIPHDYYSAVPFEPTRRGLEDVRASLRRICGRPQGWGSNLVGGSDTAASGF
jgi:hypothetical protein